MNENKKQEDKILAGMGELSRDLKKALAFLRRDLLIELSYRLSFFFQFAGIFFSVLTFYFIAKLVGESATPYLEPYGGDYFSFVLIGVAFQGYFWVGLSSFSESIREGQVSGTLEAMLVTPTSVDTIVLSSALWSYIFVTLRVLVFLVMGAFLFEVSINANLLSAAAILILTVICFSSLGIISASFIMVFKRGDPINWLFGSLSTLLGGVFYPVSILPKWLQTLSGLLPITYSLRGIRYAILQGYSLSALSSEIFALLAFCSLLIPLSLICFRYAVRVTKRSGSLMKY